MVVYDTEVVTADPGDTKRNYEDEESLGADGSKVVHIFSNQQVEKITAVDCKNLDASDDFTAKLYRVSTHDNIQILMSDQELDDAQHWGKQRHSLKDIMTSPDLLGKGKQQIVRKTLTEPERTNAESDA